MRRAGVDGVMLAELLVATALTAASARPAVASVAPGERTVPCEEVIDHVRFPYIGNRDPRFRARLVLAAVSAPGAFVPQVSPTESRPWSSFAKWGMVVRAGAGAPVTVTVPRAWRDRLAISWGNAQHDVFHTLRFPRCGLDAGTGNAYAGGFFLRRQSDCVPLRFEVGERRRVLWFGIGRRCPAR